MKEKGREFDFDLETCRVGKVTKQQIKGMKQEKGYFESRIAGIGRISNYTWKRGRLGNVRIRRGISQGESLLF